MREFWRDYKEYQKKNTELCKGWYKKHWKGTVLLNLLILVIYFGWLFRESITEKISGIFSKKENENEEA